MSQRPLVIAHRGASATQAEHTLAAFQEAIDQGADGLECDVRLTADGHVVCVHDRRIDRTSDGWGVVSTKTLAELQQHDFSVITRQAPGSRRSLRDRRIAARRKRAGLQREPSREIAILTLADMLDLITSNARFVSLSIETKHPNRYGGWLEQSVVAQLQRFGLAAPPRKGPHPVILMSFSEQAIRRMRSLAPSIPRVFLMDRVPLRMRGGELPFGAAIAGPDIAIVRAHPKYVSTARAAGAGVHVWTVDRREDVRLCVDLGVDGIITNRPRDVLAYLTDM